MPLSISNSNKRLPVGNYKKQWGFTAVIFIIIFCLIELVFGHLGYKPSVKDSPEYWKIFREKCDEGNTSDMVVTLGASRCQHGIDPKVLMDNLSCSEVNVLAIAGVDTIGIFKDLSQNSDFNGTVLYSIFPRFLLETGKDSKADRQLRAIPFIDAYHNYHNKCFATQYLDNINAFISAHLQSRFILFSCDIFDRLKKRSIQMPNISQQHLDRFCEYNVNLTTDHNDYLKEKWAKDEYYDFVDSREEYDSNSEIELWNSTINEIWRWAQAIEKRGGKVILIRMPSSGRYWELEQIKWPKEKYWDSVASISPISMIHFLDIPGSDKFECPDYSHLYHEDAEKFTKLLTKYLIEKGIMESFQ